MRRRIAVALTTAVLAAIWFAAPARAAGTVIHVNTTKDIVADDGKCSLREAVNAANLDSASGTKPGECPAGSNSAADNIILKKKTTYVLSIAGADEDANANGDLDAGTNIEITGAIGSTIKQTVTSRVLDVLTGATVIVTRIKLTGGHTPDGVSSGPADGSSGGGVRNAGTLTLDRSAVTKNTTGNGAPPSLGGPGGTGGLGGGIYNAGAGTLTLTHAVVSQNSTGKGTTTVAGGPTHPGGSGGGINNAGSATIGLSTITANTAGVGSPGNIIVAPSTGGSGGDGGGIVNSGAATITRSLITGNTAGIGGVGGTGFSFSGGGTGATGGTGGTGGGIASSGALTISQSTISGDHAGAAGSGGPGGAGAGGHPGGGNGGNGGIGGSGGGITVTAGAATIDSDTLFANRSGIGGLGGPEGTGTPNGTGGSPGIGGNGGGLFVTSSASARNLTISANHAVDGGGIAATASIGLNNVTLTRNVAEASGGGLFQSAGTFTVADTILAGNQAQSGPDCAGTFNDHDFNLVKNTSGCSGFTAAGDVTGKDPKLGPLANNGGPTKTHALKKHSPAINAGNPAPPGVGPCEIKDQRGATRTDCDIGAFEKAKL